MTFLPCPHLPSPPPTPDPSGLSISFASDLLHSNSLAAPNHRQGKKTWRQHSRKDNKPNQSKSPCFVRMGKAQLAPHVTALWALQGPPVAPQPLWSPCSVLQPGAEGRWWACAGLSNIPPDSHLPVRQVGDFCCSAAMLHLATPLLEQQNTKKLYGTKNICVREKLGRFWTKDTKKPKKPHCHF